MNRRKYTIISICIALLLTVPVLFYAVGSGDAQNIVNTEYPTPSTTTVDAFNQIITTSKAENWQSLPMSALMTKIALSFLDTPYQAGTLENPQVEQCRINFGGFDCVTYYEAVVCIARNIKLQRLTLEELLAEIEFTRYRKGKMQGYDSRLHYTSEWITDNQSKQVVIDISAELGATKYVGDVNFMSTNPDKYPALVEHPEFISKIAAFEKLINRDKRLYIDQDDIEAAYDKLQNCDIVCISTSIAGLDYAHTGFVHFDEEGNCRLLHASTTHGIYLDSDLAEYIRNKKYFTGISISRPLDPSATIDR